MNDMVTDGHGFRLRGREVSRVEALSDAVFGFAITLLVVSLDVPRTFDELTNLMSGFLAFGVTFAILLAIWHVHYTWFRRFGMQDLLTIILNSVLLFVVVFYIYPLKFMFTLLLGGAANTVRITPDQSVQLMSLYSLSVVLMFGIFVLMHVHALRKRVLLGLDAFEVHVTWAAMRYCLIWVILGLASMALSMIGGIGWVAMAGMLYGLIGPMAAINGIVSARRAPVRSGS